jgi:hypothetical protein
MTPSRFRFRPRQDGDLTVDQLSDRISTYGLAASERQLEQFARRLMAAGEIPHLTGLMLDRDAAPVVRERAFARAAVSLHNTRRPFSNVA